MSWPGYAKAKYRDIGIACIYFNNALFQVKPFKFNS